MYTHTQVIPTNHILSDFSYVNSFRYVLHSFNQYVVKMFITKSFSVVGRVCRFHLRSEVENLIVPLFIDLISLITSLHTFHSGLSTIEGHES